MIPRYGNILTIKIIFKLELIFNKLSLFRRIEVEKRVVRECASFTTGPRKIFATSISNRAPGHSTRGYILIGRRVKMAHPRESIFLLEIRFEQLIERFLAGTICFLAYLLAFHLV